MNQETKHSPKQTYRWGHPSLKEEYKQGLRGKREKSEADLRVILRKLEETPVKYVLTELNEHDDILRKAIRNQGKWFTFSAVRGRLPDTNEQSLLEDLYAVVRNYGEIWDENTYGDSRGMFRSTYRVWPVEIRNTTDAGLRAGLGGMRDVHEHHWEIRISF